MLNRTTHGFLGRRFAAVAIASITFACAGCGSDTESKTDASLVATTLSSAESSTTDDTTPEVTVSETTEPEASVTSAAVETSMPATTSVETSTTSAAPAEILPCAAADVTATAEPMGDSAMMNTKLVVEVTNTSDAPCALPDSPPTLAGLGDDGVAVQFPTDNAGTYFGSPPPLNGPLDVGGTAVVWIGGGQPGACDPLDATQTWPSMLLGLPDGSTIPFTTTFDTKCGVTGITPFGTP